MNGEEGMTDLVRVRYICPYKNTPSFLKKMPSFLKNIPSFLKNAKVFLHHSVCELPIFQCGRRHQVTRTYASGYTYIRISLHVRTHKPTYIIKTVMTIAGLPLKG